jgi:hypothetical protein
MLVAGFQGSSPQPQIPVRTPSIFGHPSPRQLACILLLCSTFLNGGPTQDVDAELSADVRKRINPAAFAKWSSNNDIYEFVGSTKASHSQFLDKRGRVSAKLSKVIVAVHKSAPVFDVFAQQQNFIASLVWGTLRFLVQVRYRRPLPHCCFRCTYSLH